MNARDTTSERTFAGIGVSPGIARARVRLSGQRFVAPVAQAIDELEVEEELRLLDEALDRTRSELQAIRDRLEAEVGPAQADLFEAHLLMIEDNTVIGEVKRRVAEERHTVDSVYFAVMSRYLESLRMVSDAYLSERAIDVEDVARRVLRNLEAARAGGDPVAAAESDGDKATSSPGLAHVGPNLNRHLVIAHDLTPSDTISMDRTQVLGFATESGSPTSHTAILSRSLGIPAVVGVRGLLDELRNGDDVLLDGYNGLVILSPSDQTLYEYDQLEAEKLALHDELRKLAKADTRTADGRPITLSGNIEFVHEIEQLKASGGEGVGLYRTEFFYVSEADLRSENRQAEIYSEAARLVAPHEVIIRTLDVGGDKLLPELHREPEPNPFLGWRGIRVSLAEPELFKDQLRAILRASAEGSVGVMYPFISSVDEVRQANELLDEAMAELRALEVPYDEDIQIGAMIEIPSAAMIADAIAAEVNFLSIGTNDLVQYTLAVDRVNERVANCFQPAHPAVIRLMKMTIDAAHRNDIWAGVCGEVAGDLRLAPLMVGMEVDELSVGVNQLLGVRCAISRLDTAACRQVVEEVLEMASPEQVLERLDAMAREAYPELLA